MGALVASAMVGNADTMAELGSVPLGPCHGPWSERRQWMVGRASGAFFASVHVCNSCRYNKPRTGHFLTRVCVSYRRYIIYILIIVNIIVNI